MRTPSQERSEFAELVEEPLRRIEEQVKSIALARLESMHARLEIMEHELDEFLRSEKQVARQA